MMNADLKPKSNKSLPARDRELGSQLPDEILPLPLRAWPETGYHVLPHLWAGAVLGGTAGCTSLVVNIIGSVLWPAISGVYQHPLRIIQVYLTFPLGFSALQLNSGLVLAFACVLYLLTGMFYGMLFELVISYLLPHANAGARLISFAALALVLWAVNFYMLLSWFQPLVTGGRWILDLVPWWVGMLTHLVFGLTMALLYPVRLSAFDAQPKSPR
jgi:hypothetical protein